MDDVTDGRPTGSGEPATPGTPDLSGPAAPAGPDVSAGTPAPAGPAVPGPDAAPAPGIVAAGQPPTSFVPSAVSPAPDASPATDAAAEPGSEPPSEPRTEPAADDTDGLDTDADDPDGASALVGAGAGKGRKGKAKKQTSFLRELPVLFVIAIALALVIKTFLVQAFYIPSPSMTNTLQVGDRVLVNKLVYRFRDIHRGEIVVFDGRDSFFTPDPGSAIVAPPSNGVERVRRRIGSLLGLGTPGEKDYIKRVIGLPGDSVACCDPQGRVLVNSTPLDEPYLFEDDKQPFGPVTVPEGRIFVLGDHRSRSSDSRAHIHDANKGTVSTDKVIGRAFVVIWPPDNFKGLRVPRQLEESALPAQPWSVTALPPVLGFAVALPVTLLRRRLRARR